MMKKRIIILTVMVLLLFSSCLTAGKSRSIMVTGTGVVTAAPDRVTFDITFTETADTTAQVREKVNEKINLALSFLKKAGINEASIKTSRINYRKKTRWNDGKEIFLGQEASQVLHISMDLENQSDSLNRLIDELTTIDGLGLGSLDFSIGDRSALEQKARELAYKEAVVKAEDYARFAGLSLGTLLSLSENQIMAQPGLYDAVQLRAESMKSTSIMTGENQITITVYAVFDMR